MQKGKIILGALALLVASMVPVTVARAGDGGLNTVHLSFCEMELFFGTDLFPNLYFDSVDVYDSGGAFVENINVYGHNAESRNVGYTIGSLVGHWGHQIYGVTEHKRVDAPSCTMKKLIDMYVYYSSTPFFGNTHTLTIFSAVGFPSKAVVTSLAGGRLPDGFKYGPPACWGALYDDGGKGAFDCDSYLAGVGERRAFLRNDPEGPEFDLLPKIEKYLEMLKGMGVTP